MKSNWIHKEPVGPFLKLIISLVFIIIIPLAGIGFWYNWALQPPAQAGEEKIFVINKGESVNSFSQKLKEEGLIRNVSAFQLYLKVSGIDKQVQAGSFRLSPSLAAQDLARQLTEGRLDAWVTVPEGYRKEQIAQLLAEDFLIDEEQFLAGAQEGYLFPDTYLIPLTADAETISEIFRRNFAEKFTERLLREAESKGFSQDQVLTIASIVEREATSQEQRPVVAGILIKRWREGIALAADATVQYVLGFSDEEEKWWRNTLTSEDLQNPSPYNTRLHTGLPPGPICNPGLSSIASTIRWEESPYYFYLHDSEGNIHYAETYQEHLENIENYLR